MITNKTGAVTLRRIDYSETSQIVSFFTRDYGKISAIAKGAKRSKSKFEGALDLLTYSEILFVAKPGQNLDILTECEILDNFPLVRKDLRKIYATLRCTKIVNDLTTDADPNRELFDLFLTVLHQIGEEGNERSIVFAFQLRALELTGYRPQIAQCVMCGLEPPIDHPASFSPAQGGLLCHKCRGSDTMAMTVVPETLAALRALSRMTATRTGRLRLSNRAADQMQALLERYTSYVLGREPRPLSRALSSRR